MWLLYALAASILWGLNYTLNERVFQHRISPITLLALQALVGSLVYLTVGYQRGHLRPDFERLLTGQGVAALIALTVVTALVGNLFISFSIQARNATMASLIELSYPIFTVFFTWLLFGHNHLSWGSLLGGALILAGVLVIFLVG
ncbi:MAG TPA: DMT family transporter [Candidatus Nitrosotenuis sp.]|nr:DMT family transporter [Candidatus Nitrosotenuis sp.]